MGGASKNKKIRDRVDSGISMEDGSPGNGLLAVIIGSADRSVKFSLKIQNPG